MIKKIFGLFLLSLFPIALFTACFMVEGIKGVIEFSTGILIAFVFTGIIILGAKMLVDN